MGHDGGQGHDDIVRVAFLLTSGLHEVSGKAKLVVDLDEEIGQSDPPHSLGEPEFEIVDSLLRFRIKFFRTVFRELPAVTRRCGVRILVGSSQEEVVCRTQTLLEILRPVCWGGGDGCQVAPEAPWGRQSWTDETRRSSCFSRRVFQRPPSPRSWGYPELPSTTSFALGSWGRRPKEPAGVLRACF